MFAPGRRHLQGFTLIELMIVVAIIAVLGMAAYWLQRAALRNANAGGAIYEMSLRLQGLRARAISEGYDHLFVVVDAPNSGSNCGILSPKKCLQWFVLENPSSAWYIDGFDPSDPTANVTGANSNYLVDSQAMPTGIHLASTQPSSLPAPFTNSSSVTSVAKITETPSSSTLTATCSSRTCFAFRFGADGKVSAEFPSTSTATTQYGYCFGIGTDLATAGLQRAILVGFPTGIVKTFSY